MDVDTYFSPPDPSGEVRLPIVPTDPPQAGNRARTAVLVAGALIAVAGVFVLGRWTTGGERDALAGERDAARQERSALDTRVTELERDVANATATNNDYESAIADLEKAAADDLAELNRLRTQVTQGAKRNDELEDSNRAQWQHVAAVSTCASAVTAADTGLDKWDAMLPVLDEYLSAEPGSPEETDAGERLDQAWQAIDDAEKEYTAASTRCTSALDALPDCDGERATIEVAVEAFKAKHAHGPTSEEELVAAGFITQPVGEYDLTNGEVTPAPGSPCPSAD
jgi:DNA repair exonuclease SbcCD ATPase subunit